jgi:hypothetical protein
VSQAPNPSKLFPMPPPPPLEAVELGHGIAERAQQILDLLHRQITQPGHAAVACMIAAASFAYQQSDAATTQIKVTRLAKLLLATTDIQHRNRPKPAGTMVQPEGPITPPTGKGPTGQ